jgi:hypothetical protein
MQPEMILTFFNSYRREISSYPAYHDRKEGVFARMKCEGMFAKHESTTRMADDEEKMEQRTNVVM